MAERAFGRREVLRGLLLGAAGLSLPAACGLPSGGAPIVDGPGPSAGTGGLSTGGTLPDPAAATSPEDLVEKYLGAAIGPLDQLGRADDIQGRVRSFLTQKAQQSLPQGNPPITLVRPGRLYRPTPRDPRTGDDLVTIDLQQVGQLNARGSVDPSVGPSIKCQFRVITNSDSPGA